MKSTIEKTVSYAEKRAEPRNVFNAFVRLHVTSVSEQEIRASACPGMLTDVSISGVGLLVPKALNRGDWFQLESDSSGQSFPPSVAVSSPGCLNAALTWYAVAHCHQEVGGLFAVGARKIDDSKPAEEGSRAARLPTPRRHRRKA